jgi:hypothetical protein
MMDPLFYRNNLARRYYKDHVDRVHPEFAAWDGRVQLVLALVVLVGGFSAVLFFGSSRFPTSYASLFGTIFVLCLLLSILLIVIGQVRMRRFREQWKEEHPVSALLETNKR